MKLGKNYERNLGAGGWHRLRITRDKKLICLQNEVTPDVLTDLAYVPSLNGSMFILSSGNGQLMVYSNFELKAGIQAHCQDISSIDCTEIILSSSWDGSVKLVT